MASNYSWNRVRYRSGKSQYKGDQLTRWIAIAAVLAIVCHAVVLVAMNKFEIKFEKNSKDISTEPIFVRSVEDIDYIKEAELPTEIEQPPETAEELLTELEMLQETPKDMDIDFSPTVEEPEMSVEMEIPPIKGDAMSSSVDMTAGDLIDTNIEDLGNTDDFIKPEKGQITIDAGKQNADKFDPDKFNKELAKGAGGDTVDGAIDGYTPLAEMMRLSKSDLEKSTGMIGSDLLYDFGKATLRDSAKNSLMKVVLLIDKNPSMKCWIEGHTDLIGTEEANLKLSLARASAVRTWLVESMKIDPKRLYIRGMGKSAPIVLSGDQDEQAINRRVEIKLRSKAPPEGNRAQVIKKPRVITPKINPNDPSNPPPKAVPVDEEENLPKLPKPPKPPKAIPVEDDNVSPTDPLPPLPEPQPKPPKAIPVE